MIATIFFLSGAGLIVFALGVFAGIWLGRLGDRPAVTAWGEHTDLWSETDWYWYEHCGRFSDTDMVRQIRSYRPDDVERISRMAGTDAEGSILPPEAGYGIDRRPNPWWTS